MYTYMYLSLSIYIYYVYICISNQYAACSEVSGKAGGRAPARIRRQQTCCFRKRCHFRACGARRINSRLAKSSPYAGPSAGAEIARLRKSQAWCLRVETDGVGRRLAFAGDPAPEVRRAQGRAWDDRA